MCSDPRCSTRWIAKEQDKGCRRAPSSIRPPPTPRSVTPSTHRRPPHVSRRLPTPKLQAGERPRRPKPDVFGRALSLFQVLSSRVEQRGTALSAGRRVGPATPMVTFTRKRFRTCLRADLRRARGPRARPPSPNALQQWATQMPPGSATVEAAGDRGSRFTACDPGSAATRPSRTSRWPSLVYVAKPATGCSPSC